MLRGRLWLRKLNKYLPFFASELVLVLLAITAIGANISLRTNASAFGGTNRSLFFSYLLSRPAANPHLLSVSGSVSQKVASRPNLMREVLAASAVASTSDEAPLPSLAGSAILKPNPASSGAVPKKDIAVYEVRPGDTVARIASAYGISEYTVVQENNLGDSSLIRPGQELRILPVSGIKHTVKEGETIAGIAKKYNVGAEDILEYNEIEIEDFILPGDELVIPGGSVSKPVTPKRQQYLIDLQREDVKRVEVPPDLPAGGDYIWPLPGAHRLSQGYTKRHPGIDVPCRDCEVVAASGGVVELSGTQKGYGKTIVINHGGGKKTRYAHGSNLLVSAGDRVEQGQTIMISGSTGRSTGPHLHFEIFENAGRVNPLSRVK